MSYAVVRFLEEDNSYSEVPVQWLTPSRSQCYWPNNVKNATQLMSKKSLPKENWTLHSIKVEGLYNTLEKARKVAQCQDYTSSEEVTRTRKNPKKKKNSSEYSSEQEESDITPPPSPGLNKTNKDIDATDIVEIPIDLQQAVSNEILFIDCQQIQENNASVDTNNICTHDFGTDSSSTGTSQNFVPQTFLLEKIYKLQIENNLMLKAITAKLEKIGLHCIETNISTEKCLILKEKLPLRNINDIKHFDELLIETEFKSVFLKFIQGIGGSSSKDFIHRCLRAVYSNEVAVMCSWLGLRGNYKISSSNSMELIKVVIKETYSAVTDKEFERTGSEWFRLAKLRLNKHK
ncbi:hypothetical protein FQR65_LT19207 [Abscondita terminalis]|nr:hypothetical protein FQR65_LT19207 [Abscondita terminalis]